MNLKHEELIVCRFAANHCESLIHIDNIAISQINCIKRVLTVCITQSKASRDSIVIGLSNKDRSVTASLSKIIWHPSPSWC